MIKEIKEENLVFSQCFLFPKITRENEYLKKKEIIKHLITGIQKDEIKRQDIFFFCSTAREYDDMCGLDGKKYEEKKNDIS
jgi:hypothetical protein